MSTAGKVLISLIVLFSLVWIISIAGVDQLNRNGNKQLADLNKQIAELNEKVKKIQHDVVETKDQIAIQQEKTDYEITRLRAAESNVELARSEMAEILMDVQHELANVQTIVENAKLDQNLRLQEKEAEIKAISAAEAELETLKGTNTRMLARIADLREKFRDSYRAGLDFVNQSQTQTK